MISKQKMTEVTDLLLKAYKEDKNVLCENGILAITGTKDFTDVINDIKCHLGGFDDAYNDLYTKLYSYLGLFDIVVTHSLGSAIGNRFCEDLMSNEYTTLHISFGEPKNLKEKCLHAKMRFVNRFDPVPLMGWLTFRHFDKPLYVGGNKKWWQIWKFTHVANHYFKNYKNYVEEL